MALDLLLLNQLQRLNRNVGYNEFFPRRPLFAYYSGINASYNFVVDFYSEFTTVPMRTFISGGSSWGAPPSIAIASSTESNQNYWWGGMSSGSPGTSSGSPNGGYVGITGHAQTRCLNNVDFNAEQFLSFNYAFMSGLEANNGVILGEPGYRQGLNLYRNGSQLAINYIGDNSTLNVNTGVAAGDKAFDWTTGLTGISRLPGTNTVGRGDIGYNRKTNTLAFIEGTGNTNYQYRIHIFKNLPKLRASAEHLRLALLAAITGGSATYETFDFVWNGGVNDTEWHQRTRIVLCDDGTIWLGRQATSSSLRLARIYFSSGTTRAFEEVRAVTTSTAYSTVQSNYNGIRHMVSDNGAMVALYHQYYYYLCGVCAVFLPRDSAADKTRHNWMQVGDTSYGYSIAPAGGSSFVIGGPNTNADGRVVDGTLINLENPASLTQLNHTIRTQDYNISGYPQSTSYGGTGFIKVQDPLSATTEWRER